MNDDSKRQRFSAAYEGKPPWDLGRPQKPFVDHADQIAGSVLDIGCGTGENALFFAKRGQTVLGIDFVAVPIERARRKAEQRGVPAEFLQWDALRLEELDRTFDSAIDCGLFHVLSDEDRRLYVDGLAHVLNRGGRVFLMCFSDEEPGDEGPRRISQSEIRTAFADGWTIESITATRFEANPDTDRRHFGDDGPKAWFAAIRRTE
jgi:cyclopropane fatty-acyl-phospholipid synthase-like methyltransferase